MFFDEFLCLTKKNNAVINCIIIAKKAALDPDIKPKNNTIINGKYFSLFFSVNTQLNIHPAIDNKYVPKAGGSKVTDEIL